MSGHNSQICGGNSGVEIVVVRGCETQISSGRVDHASRIDPWVESWWSIGSGGRWGWGCGWVVDSRLVSIFYGETWRVMSGEILCWVKIWVCVWLSRNCKKI